MPTKQTKPKKVGDSVISPKVTQKPKHSLETLLQIVADNPYTGTTEQIASLSIGIADASTHLDKSTYALFKQESGIKEKLLSKLKVIGSTLLKIEGTKRQEVIKHLPASYSTIHALCALKPEELVTAVKSGVIKRDQPLSTRATETYVKQVRFPRQFLEGDKERWDAKEEPLFVVLRPEDTTIDQDQQESLLDELRILLHTYGLVVRKEGDTRKDTLKRQDRAEREVFWSGVLEKELTRDWFDETPVDLRKQFNLKTRDELIDTPLRSFTGFLMKNTGGRKDFWEKHGRAYVAKVHLLQEKTDDNAQRYNFKRRIEGVLAERGELAVWRNILVKENGFI